MDGALVSVTRAHPHVAAVYTNGELARMPIPTLTRGTGPFPRTALSFDAERSGNVLILLDRAVTPIPEPMPNCYIATRHAVGGRRAACRCCSGARG